MQIHGSCAARGGAGVLIVGPPASGKSDLVLRLLDQGFMLVADDRVMIEHGIARAPAALAGLIEVRGLGIVRLPHLSDAQLALLVQIRPVSAIERLPAPQIDPIFGLPVIDIDPSQPSAAQRIALALDCATGGRAQLAGAFAA